jgi:hypothetical protein
MPITINGSGTITGASTLATAVVSPTLTTPNIDSASIPTISGTAPLYMARAWVNFNGTGTVAIRASGNVSSVTDNGTGDYTLNFTTAMPDTNYAGIGSNGSDTASGLLEVTSSGKSVTAQRVLSKNGTNNASADQSLISVAIFR